MSSTKSSVEPGKRHGGREAGALPRPVAIRDDPALHELFLADMRSQDDIWKPTAYWLEYCDRISAELARSGLKQFRRNWNLTKGFTNTPAAPDLPPFRSQLAQRIYRVLKKAEPFRSLEQRYRKSRIQSQKQLDIAASNQAALLHALLARGDHASRLLARVQESGVGKPVISDVSGRSYTPNLLRRIGTFALALQAAPDAPLRRVIEIGGGYGVMPEILIKYLDGDIDCFVAIDIPPVVYIQTQYLKALFPGRVLDYRDLRERKTIEASDLAGKIAVLPPWMLPRLNLEFDLFYNSISFQEMEIPIVRNYLDIVAPRSARIDVAPNFYPA